MPTFICSTSTAPAQASIDATLLRPPSTQLQCRETSVHFGTDGGKDSEGSPIIAFTCTVWNNSNNTSSDDKIQQFSTLTFHCREPSYGVLTSNEAKDTAILNKDTFQRTEEQKGDDDGDFDFGMMLFTEESYPYALAGRTGFQIWPGSRILVDVLTFPKAGDNQQLRKWQNNILQRKNFRVLELGAGVGVVGASLAAAAAEVLLTDLPKVTTMSLIPNLILNNSKQDLLQRNCPAWLASGPNRAVSIGRGWAAASSLDWNKPLEDQLTREQYNVDLVIASDCVWLASMLEGLLATVAAIFEAARKQPSRRTPQLLLSFQRRDSEMFTTVDRVMKEIDIRGWSVECLAWYPVEYEDASIKTDQESSTKEVFLFEVSSTS